MAYIFNVRGLKLEEVEEMDVFASLTKFIRWAIQVDHFSRFKANKSMVNAPLMLYNTKNGATIEIVREISNFRKTKKEVIDENWEKGR